jgi:hypothetical protein
MNAAFGGCEGLTYLNFCLKLCGLREPGSLDFRAPGRVRLVIIRELVVGFDLAVLPK